MNILLTMISPLNKRGQEVKLKCQTVKFIAHEVKGRQGLCMFYIVVYNVPG